MDNDKSLVGRLLEHSKWNREVDFHHTADLLREAANKISYLENELNKSNEYKGD